MNNKKLFKGALVLFASILMAVSCSAGDKTGGGDKDKQDPPALDTRTEITEAKLKAALVKGLNGSDGFVFKDTKKVQLTDTHIGISTSTADILKIVITDKSVTGANTAKANTLAHLKSIGGDAKTPTSTLTKALAELGITFDGTKTVESSASGASVSFNKMTASLDTKNYKLGKIGELKDSFNKVEITVIIKDTETWN